jgi:cation transport ATPase
MSYLICKKCGKEYPLPEGKESFNYQNCECGGKLEYSPLPKRNYVMTQQDLLNTQRDLLNTQRDTQQDFPNTQRDLFNTQQDSTTEQDFPNKEDGSPITQQDPQNKQYTRPSPHSRIKWKGVLVGLSFLFISLILSVMIAFGENIPTSPSDIPIEFLTYFSMIITALTIFAGSISAYLSGSKKFLEGALNGGMVGVILGFILGLAGGALVFLSGILIFGSISMIGGIIGIFPRKLFK